MSSDEFVILRKEQLFFYPLSNFDWMPQRSSSASGCDVSITFEVMI